MATITAARLRHDCADHLGDLKLGTATAGAATTMTDATRRTEDTNYWAGAFLKLYGGTGTGQERCVASSTNAGVLTVEAAWATNPDATSTYELHRLFEAAEYDRFVTMALEHLTHSRQLLQHKVDDSTLAWVTDQYEYTVPSGFVGIYQIDVATDTGTPAEAEWQAIPNELWSLKRTGTTSEILFNTRTGNYGSTYDLRLSGYQEFTLPTADTDTYTFSSLPVSLLAAALAAESLIGRDPSNKYQQLADRLSARGEAALAQAVSEVINPATRWILPH